MLKHLKFLILLVLPFSFATALTSCSDDDNEVNPDDPAQYDIVGKWQYIEGNDEYTIEFDKNGYLYWEGKTFSSWDGTGSWKYNSKSKAWDVEIVGSPFPAGLLSSGIYKIVGDKLIDQRGHVYTRIAGSSSGSSTSLLAGTSWQGTDRGEERCSKLQIKFNNDDTFTEVFAGSTDTYPYTVVDNTIILGDDAADSQLNCCLGRTIYFSTNSSGTELTLQDHMNWRMIFTKK